MKTDDKTLIEALRILSRDIQSGDGVTNACIAEAADRLEELTQWRDISTAPKDGAEILVIIAGNHPQADTPYIPDLVSWDEENLLFLPIEPNDGAFYDKWNDMLTHWMPLPNPPKTRG